MLIICKGKEECRNLKYKKYIDINLNTAIVTETNQKRDNKMCKVIENAKEFYDERMSSATDIAESLKEIAADEQGNEIGELIKNIDASLKVTEKMKLELANMIISKVTDYVWSDSLNYYKNGGV